MRSLWVAISRLSSPHAGAMLARGVGTSARGTCHVSPAAGCIVGSRSIVATARGPSAFLYHCNELCVNHCADRRYAVAAAAACPWGVLIIIGSFGPGRPPGGALPATPPGESPPGVRGDLAGRGVPTRDEPLPGRALSLGLNGLGAALGPCGPCFGLGAENVAAVTGVAAREEASGEGATAAAAWRRCHPRECLTEATPSLRMLPCFCRLYGVACSIATWGATTCLEAAARATPERGMAPGTRCCPGVTDLARPCPGDTNAAETSPGSAADAGLCFGAAAVVTCCPGAVAGNVCRP